MQKTLAFLEQNVQWVALALGALFFGFCVWAYVLTPPAEAKIPGLKEPVTPSGIDELTHNGPVTEIERAVNGNEQLAVNVDDVVKPWQAKMNAVNAKPLVAYTPPLYPMEVIIAPTLGGPTSNHGLIAKLPELPKAGPQNPAAGMSVVSIPAPTAGGVAQPAAAAANFDQEWSTASFVIAAKDLQPPFAKIQNDVDQMLAARNLPKIELHTDVLRIELQRQRATQGGTFPNGDAGVEVVPATKLQTEMRPMPDAKAGLAEKVSYYEWAEKNLEMVYQPKFYDVHGGAPWAAPTMGGGAPAAAAPKPATGIPPVLPKMPAPGLANPALGGAAAGAKNPGQIVANAITQDLLVWAHDDSVQPGQIYRYRIVYYMKNPVLGLTGIADPSIESTLPIKSPPSDWSAPVTIPQVTKFWFAGGFRSSGAVAEVYHWENGNWTRKEGNFGPGDRVADSEWTVIDVHGQQPGARDREKYVILTNDAGEIIRRYPSVDRSSEEKKALNAQIGGAAAGGTAPPQPTTPTPRPAAPAGGQRAGVMPRSGG